MHLYLFMRLNHFNRHNTRALDPAWPPAAVWPQQAVLCPPASVPTSLKWRQPAWVMSRRLSGKNHSMVCCLSPYSLFHLGEKRHARSSIVVLKDLATPTHTVLKWPEVSSTTPEMKKTNKQKKTTQTHVPRTNAAVHLGFGGGTRHVQSNIQPHPNTSRLRRS